MKSQMWLIYGIACTCMIMYLCWNMGAMTSQPRYRIFCQQYMRDSRENVLHRRLNYSIGEHVLTTPALSHPTYPDTTTILQKKSDQITPFPPTVVSGKDINPDIAKFFTFRSNETKDLFINLHHYEFNLNSQICSNGDLFLIIVVHSAPGNYKRRELIRTTYGSVHMYRGKKTGVVFMLGAVGSRSLQESITKESKQRRDIVQGNFTDSYKSLNRKHVMAMHWFKQHCKADYILKLDDDTFVNPFRIVDFSLKLKPDDMTMHCKLISREEPVRSPRSKWYTSRSQYPFSIFPPFCLGFAYLTTPRAWLAMYKESENNRLMDMDDLYVSVVLAMKAKVQKVDMNKMMYPCPNNVYSINVKKLNRMSVFIDRGNRCGQKPFANWKKIRDLNKDVHV